MSMMHYMEQIDSDKLLHTKLIPPHLRAALVTRAALFTRLDAGLERRLTLLSAPAGFGKTTLLSSWMSERAAKGPFPPLAWVSLDAGDNDPARFLRYVITACQVAGGNVGKVSLEMLRNSCLPSMEGVLTTFINELAQLPQRCILVLEDYHAVTAAQIHEMLGFLLDHQPAPLHLIVITRCEPALPLARLRACGELCEIHAADLRFSRMEMQTFLQQTLSFEVSAEVLTRLEARTEGWPAGLRLLTLTLQGRQEKQEVEQMLLAATGNHRHILDYLIADVFSAQSQPLQTFLLQTCFLSRLQSSLCDVVTQREDSARLLNELERANLFLVPLDESGTWYRYHALFAEALQYEARRRLGEARVLALFQRASVWYEQRGMFTEAVECSLAANGYERAACLIEGCTTDPHYFVSEIYTLRRWVAQIPEEVLQRHPVLCLNYAHVLLFTSDRYAPAVRSLVEEPLQMAERYWQAEANRPRLGEVQALRSLLAWWQGDMPLAFTAANRALEWLPEEEHRWRGGCMLFLAWQALFEGRIAVAHQIALEAQGRCGAIRNAYGVRAALFVQGEACSARGDLHEAAHLYRQVLASADEDITDKGSALARLSGLSYEWNELEAAEQAATQALDYARQAEDEDLRIRASLALVRVLLVRGKQTQARRLLQDLVVYVQQYRHPMLYREVRMEQARLALALGDLALVQHWYETCTGEDRSIPQVQREREKLLFARLLIVQGKGEQAVRLLEHCLPMVRERQHIRHEIELLLVLAQAYAASNHSGQVRASLMQALQLAYRAGYQRLILDERMPMASLLKGLLPEIKDEAFASYLRTLLRTFASEQRESTAESVGVGGGMRQPVEPLSRQERRVLRLLSAGLSNPEIANELVVSVNTIKTQVQSIYRKLAVSNRQEARVTARQLCLL